MINLDMNHSVRGNLKRCSRLRLSLTGGGRVGGGRTRNRVGVAAVIVSKAAAALPLPRSAPASGTPPPPALLSAIARRANMQSCPCCRQPTHHQLLPNERRLGAALAQLSPSPTRRVPKDAPFLPLKGDRADPTRHGRPTGSYGSFEGLRNPKDPAKHAPFRIKHTEGGNAEPTT